jgi:hypothetical protein
LARQSAPTPPASTGGFDEAEVCESLADYHGLQSRMIIAALLRPYLDSTNLTPTELIHNASHLLTLMKQPPLIDGAIAKVIQLQVRSGNPEQQKARRKSIEGAIAETVGRARQLHQAFQDLARRGKGGALGAILSAPPGETPSQDVDYDLRAVISYELTSLRSWGGKVDRLIEMFQGSRDPRLAAVVDGVFADVFLAPAASQELFGAALVPGMVTMRLCELLGGRIVMDSSGGPGRLGMLSGWFRQNRLPQARAAIIDRIRRMLRGPAPLGRTAEQDGELLKPILALILTSLGVLGGPAMADAVTVRHSRRLEQAGVTGAYGRSIVAIGESQSDLSRRLHYFAAVSQVPAAERHLGEIIAAMDAALGNTALIETAVLSTPDLDGIKGSLASLAEAIQGSGLPAGERARMADRAEWLVDDFARGGQLVSSMRQSEPNTRRRVIRMAELTLSGLMRDDGAQPAMRQHILDQVKQPQVQLELLANGTSEIAQAEVRRLHDLLEQLRKGPPSPAKPQAARVAVAPPVVAQPAVAPPVVAPPVVAVSQPPRPQQPQQGGPAGGVTVAVPPPAAPAPAPAPAAVAPPARNGVPGLCPHCYASISSKDVCRDCGFPARSDNRPGIHLPPGSVLQARYYTGRLLGQGGFGATYLGWDDRLHVKVAVKEFYPANLIARTADGASVSPFSDEHATNFSRGLVKFLEEARVLARLRDIREIVGVQDFFEDNGTAYLVMELLQGKTMKRFVSESGGTIDPRKALTILTPIIKALQAVHEIGLVHRDISPDNIFITVTGERKLLDFGAARHAAGHGAGMTVILKPGYAPPEQYSPDGNQGPWTDVYATCATFYHALTGRTPPDVSVRFTNDVVPKLSTMGVAIPPAMETVIIAGLSLRWQDRPQSMRELHKALSAAAG